MSHPDVIDKLRHELEQAFPDPRDLSLHDLNKLSYLEAVINECIRLSSPFVGWPRVVPPAGTVIDGVYVPGGTIVGVPTYAQEVSEENFWPAPKSFKPERWFPEGLGPGTRTRKTAIMAFSFGK